MSEAWDKPLEEKINARQLEFLKESFRLAWRFPLTFRATTLDYENELALGFELLGQRLKDSQLGTAEFTETVRFEYPRNAWEHLRKHLGLDYRTRAVRKTVTIKAVELFPARAEADWGRDAFGAPIYVRYHK